MILNLTQHKATPEQKDAGVVDYHDARAEFLREQEKTGGDVAHLATELPESLSDLLTFEQLPTRGEINDSALQIGWIAQQLGCKRAMIGGAPFLMSAIERELKDRAIQPLYAFSKRKSVEVQQDDGSVVKRNVFRHIGFVKM